MGPSTGKSTLAASLFVRMKKMGHSVELVTEYAKQMVFEDRMNVLTQDQLYILAKQHRKILVLRDTVDYIITDSPFVQGMVYLNEDIYNKEYFGNLILSTFNSYPNFNILFRRCFNYEEMGRYQDEESAKLIDADIENFIDSINIQYCVANPNYATTERKILTLAGAMS